jgi:hypothetical protein
MVFEVSIPSCSEAEAKGGIGDVSSGALSKRRRYNEIMEIEDIDLSAETHEHKGLWEK